MCTNVRKEGAAEAAPQRNETLPNLNEAGEELVRALESALAKEVLSRVKARVNSLERRIAALEKETQEVVRPPESGDISSSKEEEAHVLVAPIKGVDEDGRLILGDKKILSASALKI